MIAGVAGWRVVFLAAAVVMLGLAAVLYRAVPAAPAKTAQPYRALLLSVLTLVRRDRTLRVAMSYGAIAMATFTLFWTGLTFLLSAPPYG